LPVNGATHELSNFSGHPIVQYTRVCTDGLLYGVTGPTGVLLPQGFTIDLIEDERYSVDLIATWSPDDKVYPEFHKIRLDDYTQTNN